MTSRDLHYQWERQLRSTPEQLWPYISATQRFNRVAAEYRVHTTDVTDEDVQSAAEGINERGISVVPHQLTKIAAPGKPVRLRSRQAAFMRRAKSRS